MSQTPILASNILIVGQIRSPFLTFISLMMARPDVLLLSVLFIATVSSVAFADDEADCVYTFYIRTGSTFKSGSDSIISARIYDKYGDYIGIRNLEAWGGLMGPGYNYYERGNLDIFSGKAPCLPSPVCSLNLTSDGSGDHHGWYVNYVEVTTAGVHAKCAQQSFDVEQWLATDTSPYNNLTAVRNNCPVKLRESTIGRVGFEIRKTLSWIV